MRTRVQYGATIPVIPKVAHRRAEQELVDTGEHPSPFEELQSCATELELTPLGLRAGQAAQQDDGEATDPGSETSPTLPVLRRL
jgi:hypothetical protein